MTGPDRIQDLLGRLADGDVTGTVDDVTRRIRRRRQLGRSLAVASTLAIAAAVVVPLAVLTASTPAPAPNSHPSHTGPPPIRAGAITDPTDLLGLWRVSGVAGETRDTFLALGATNGDVLLRPCGEIELDWQADHSGDFVAFSGGGDARCFHEHRFTVPWLSRITGYAEQGRQILLTARDGETVATLTPERTLPADVTPDPRHDSPVTIPPVTAATRAKYAEPPALPTNVAPASPSELSGRWVGVGAPGVLATNHLSFDAGGGWTGSDGCNGYGGRYVVGAAGRLLVTAGASSLVGCGSSAPEGWFMSAERVGVDQVSGDLLLYADNGHLLGRLARQPTATIIGRFIAIGGTEGSTRPRPLHGEVNADDRDVRGDQSQGSAAARHGSFTMQVPAGRYVFVGDSQSDPHGTCTSGTAVKVSAGTTVHVTVTCELF